MGSLPPGKAGVGSAVNDTTRQTGGALGVAVLGRIFLVRYHALVGDATDRCRRASGWPCRTRSAEVSTPRRPSPVTRQQRTIDLARHAFVSAMRLVYFIAAGVVLIAAAVSGEVPPRPAAERGRRRGGPRRGARYQRRLNAPDGHTNRTVTG